MGVFLLLRVASGTNFCNANSNGNANTNNASNVNGVRPLIEFIIQMVVIVDKQEIRRNRPFH